MEDELRASLAEKEVLLREIHHRIKNNLEVVNSITAMQTNRINDPAAKESMRQLQERIRTISLVHEGLYRSGNLAEIHAQQFLSKLTENLFQAFGWSKLDLQVQAQDMIIPIDLAVPFGLIVTELVTNSMKHAFSNKLIENAASGSGSKNVILVALYSSEHRNILEVSDNGVGLPEELDWQNTRSLGLRLVNRLADQLHGLLEVENRAGTFVRLTFPR
jgi:two-component sensor histidine kinase